MPLSDEERRRIEEEERVRAEARIRAEAEARRKAEAEVAAKAAEEKKKARDTTKKGCLGCLGVLVLLFVIGIIGSLLSGSKDKSRPSEPGSDFEAKRVAQQLIEEWKSGESAAKYWKAGLPLQTLYAVRDYEHIASGGWKRKDGTWEPNKAWHRFRIKSSTKGGFSVEKLWDINLEKVGSEWKVALVTEAQ